MEKKPPRYMTPFDLMITTDMLEMIKLMIPYLPPDFQRMAGIYAKLTELQNAINYFRPPYDHSRRGRLRQKEMDLNSLMEDIGPYLGSDASEMMGNLSQAMSMMEMVQSMDMGDAMKSMNMGDIMNAMDAFSAERKDADERMDQPPCDGGHRPDETGTD